MIRMIYYIVIVKCLVPHSKHVREPAMTRVKIQHLCSVNIWSEITLKTNNILYYATLKADLCCDHPSRMETKLSCRLESNWPFTASNPSTVYLTEMVLAFIFPPFFLSSEANRCTFFPHMNVCTTMLPRCSFGLKMMPPGWSCSWSYLRRYWGCSEHHPFHYC